jgi:glutamate N-acetyltransferase/amino-acid N-acetyltransferase
MERDMIIVKGGVTLAKGFFACGIKAGIKKSGRPDLALLYSEAPAVAAGAFTTNRFQASPVRISRSHLKNKVHRAIAVNSGNANCANGSAGDRAALSMARLAADALCLDAEEVLVASTGIIGVAFPLEKVEAAMPTLASSLARTGGNEFAESILTTDTRAKQFAVKVKLGGAAVTIGGACKGVGMIYPDMKTERHATLLCFITTDAAISKRMLEAALEEAMAGSFNMVSVDGDMSTNDSCFILANAMAGNRAVTAKDGCYRAFTAALKFLMVELAKEIARDGEGATKFVEIDVFGARNDADARIIARKISLSSLLKCCIYGHDPNWGRVAAACGASGVAFDPGRVDIYLGPVKALANGAIFKGYDKTAAAKVFKGKDITIKVDLKSGPGKARSWTCDFSKEYVAINSEYST